MNVEPECFKKLEQFHTKLFLDVLGVKKFVVRSCDNDINSYLIIPVYSSGLKSYKMCVHINRISFIYFRWQLLCGLGCC